jgi:hypothetical protein
MMKKYRVHFATVASISVDVELSDKEVEDADNDVNEIAIERAYEALPGDICGQCSGFGRKWSRDQGEWELATEHRVIDGETRQVEIMPELIEDGE